MEKEKKPTLIDKEPGSPTNDEFELTAEMMVNDFDDERTLDEEEALGDGDADQDNELSNLEKEKDIPISTLLAMYGYNENNPDGSNSSSSDEVSQGVVSEKDEQQGYMEEDTDLNNAVNVPDEGIQQQGASEMDSRKRLGADDEDGSEEKRSRSMLNELYTNDVSSSGCASRHLRSGSGQQSEEDEEEDDGDYSPDEDDWKKVTLQSCHFERTIMVGNDYQAVIPEGLLTYDDAMPYENEDKLLWDPIDMAEKDAKDYLAAVQDIQGAVASGIDSIPKGSHVRDDEQALFLLLQCGNNTDEALRRIKLNSISTADTMSLWSEEECRNFENGLRQYGKDFHSIQQHRVRTRSVNELVQFYYLWKKTERHDVFANKARLEKKKYTLHPGTTDFMERFLDEQDSPVPSPNIHSLLSGDPKRLARNSPPGYSECVDPISCDEAQIINSHFEDLARHLDRDSLEFLSGLRLAANSPNKSNSPNGMSATQTIDSVSITPSRSQAFHSSSEPYLSPSSTHPFSQ